MTEREKKSLLIINYHHISDGESPESLLSIHQDVLLEQFRVLKASHVPFCKLADISKEEFQVPFAAAITVDDGNESGFKNVLPLLQEHNFPASYFPIIGKIDRPGYMTWGQLKELHALGYEIGSHGLSHDILTRLPVTAQIEELSSSRKILEDTIGTSITSFAFPYGRFDNDLLERAASSGYQRVYTTGLKINLIDTPNYLLFRWNITNKTTPEMLRQVLSSNGLLSPAVNIHNRLNSFFSKRLLGSL
jgi:peptidoglycan/xylan/chitin deacetylase (PgdA/CDA1 family)